MNLEDKIFDYLKEIYSNLNEFYEYVKNNDSDYVLVKAGVDGFESNLVIARGFNLKVSDRYSNVKFFTYKNKKGEVTIPSKLDGIFYASRVFLYGDGIKETGVLNMKSNQVISFIESIYNEVMLLNLSKSKVKKKIK